MADREQCLRDPRCLVVVRPRFDLGLEICSEDLVTDLVRPDLGLDLDLDLARPDLDRLGIEEGMFGLVPTVIDPGHLAIGDAVSEQVQTATDLDHLDPGHLGIEPGMSGLTRIEIDLAHLDLAHLGIEEGMLAQAQTAIGLDHLGLLDPDHLGHSAMTRIDLDQQIALDRYWLSG